LQDFFAGTNVTRREFAALAGISEGYLSLLLSGQRTPSLPLALRIAAEANIPVESLLPSSQAAEPPVDPTQGAGEASERAHTPPEAGSIPVPATTPGEAA